MRTLTVMFSAGDPRVISGLRVTRGNRGEQGLFLGERGAGKRWLEFVKLDTKIPPAVDNDRIRNAVVYAYRPPRRDTRRPPATYFKLTTDRSRNPELLIRINTWSPDGGPGDWPDIDSPAPMPCAYGAYDEAGTLTYKDGLVVLGDGGELPVRVAQRAYLLHVARGVLSVRPMPSG